MRDGGEYDVMLPARIRATFEVVEAEFGLELLTLLLDRPGLMMEQKTITVINNDGSTAERPMNFAPFDLEAAHIFKIHGDKIHEIEAMGFTLPLYSKNGWSQFVR